MGQVKHAHHAWLIITHLSCQYQLCTRAGALGGVYTGHIHDVVLLYASWTRLVAHFHYLFTHCIACENLMQTTEHN